jgi:hypothetical protein
MVGVGLGLLAGGQLLTGVLVKIGPDLVGLEAVAALLREEDLLCYQLIVDLVRDERVRPGEQRPGCEE